LRIAPDRVVSIDYVIRLGDGRVVESSTNEGGAPLTYLHGRAQIVPGVERAIEGAESGEVIEVVVPPDDAFGEHDPRGVFLVPRSAFPRGEEVAAGMTYSANRPDGRPVLFRVLEAQDQTVLVDTNHPLAGELLHVWVAVRGVREATDDEKIEGRVQHAPPAVPPPS
jgi:FKBP-type peptidyl-prolyl cis-trans isomerase SlyD